MRWAVASSDCLLVTSWPLQVKGEESQTAEVVNVEALLPQDRDYFTYQVHILTQLKIP